MRDRPRATGFGRSLGLCLIGAMLIGTTPAQDQPRSTVHSGVEEQAERYLTVVRLRIEPTRNATIGHCQGLGAEDLRVSIQGEILTGRETLNLDRKRPPTLHALVIDNSASMVDDLSYATFAAKEYVKQLQPDREKGLIMTFDENVVLMRSPTGERQALLDAIDRVRAGSRTSMLDALYYSMQELDAHRERPVLILLTDGADTSSMHGVQDIARQVLDRKDLTVFTIGLGLKTDQGVKPTRDLMRDLAESTHGKYFEVTEGQSLRKVFAQIRDVLENEAILTVVDPNPRARRNKIRVESGDRDCRIKILGYLGDEPESTGSREPIAQPYLSPPQAFNAELMTAHFSALTRAGESSIDPGCSAGRYFSTAFGQGHFTPRWFVHVDQRNASGCGPDVTLDHGRLYDPVNPHLFEHNDALRLTARPFEIPIPPLGQLPQSPAEALDQLARRALELVDAEFPTESWVREGAGHARAFQDYPKLIHGMTFLGMRGVLARALFLYEDYREWVLGRLAEQATSELTLLEQRYRELFPQQGDQSIAFAASHSEDGQSILAVAEAPSEIDLQPYLSAWLGDISAHDLFLDWERRRIDRAIAGIDTEELDRRFLEAWVELRRVFFAPSYARVLTMLVPVRDPGCDCVGFWRIVLPRAAWFPARVSGLTAGREVSGDQLDLVPDLPAGWLTFERMVRETPGLLPFLRQGGYRTDHLLYALLGEPSGHDPENAFSRFGAELLLAEEGAFDESSEPDVIALRSKLTRERDGVELAVELEDLVVEVTPTAISMELAEEIRQAGMRIFGQEEPAVDEPAVAMTTEETAVGLTATESVVAVQVPVQVLRDGRPVRGLTADNFQLMDRGKPREITAVEFVDLSESALEGGHGGAVTVSENSRRYVLFLFDLSFSEPGPVQRAREAVLASLDRLHPSDQVALAVYSVDDGPKLALDFSSDREQVRETLGHLGEQIARGGEADPFTDTMEGSGRAGGVEGLSAEANLEEPGPSPDAGSSAEHFQDVFASAAGSGRRSERMKLRSMCQDFANVARALTGVRGKKQVVLLSGGFDPSLVFGASDSADQLSFGESQESGRTWEIEGREHSGDPALQAALDDMLEAFRRSDTSIQAVDISRSGHGGRSGGRNARADGLHMLARGTGGQLYRDSNDLGRTLTRMLDETGVYYVLFFQPGDLEPDGSYRKLKVKLRGTPRGAKASYRAGYFAPGRAALPGAP